MRDYKEFVGRQVSVVTTGGSFVGELVKVGRTTLAMKVERAYYDDGLDAPRVSGLLLVEQSAIRFVQVR